MKNIGGVISVKYGLTRKEKNMNFIYTSIIVLVSTAILGITLLIIYFRMLNDWDGEETKASKIVFDSSIVTFVVGIVTALTILFVGKSAVEYERLKYEIYSLSVDSSVSGRFSLGSGHIGTEAMYYFYVKESKGYKLESISASNTYICELETSNYEVPCVIAKKEKRKMIEYYIIYLPQEYIIFDYSIQ